MKQLPISFCCLNRNKNALPAGIIVVKPPCLALCMLRFLRQRLYSGFQYSKVHRTVEILAILLFGLFVVLFIIELAQGPFEKLNSVFGGSALLWITPIVIIGAYLSSDFISGTIHCIADNFWHENTRFIGPNFIRSFRDHHKDQTEITRHDFIEVNGNNCLASILCLVPAYFSWSMVTEPGHWVAGLFLLLLMLGILMTNQIHKWAHMPNCPVWVRKLQKSKLILSPEHHRIHHTQPYNRYYCITNGWLNPILEKIRFFSILEKIGRSFSRGVIKTN